MKEYHADKYREDFMGRVYSELSSDSTNDRANRIIDEFDADSVFEVSGETSDGYHTFDELYHHRAALFSVICNARPDLAWKSKLHDTGDMFEGMFIVGINTPDGQATYHYDIDPYWNMFDVPSLGRAPKWDGHSPDEAINRISKLRINT